MHPPTNITRYHSDADSYNCDWPARCFHTNVVWYKLSDVTVWSKSKRQPWKLPRTVFWTKQPNLDPTKSGGVSPDQTKPLFGSCPVCKYCFIRVQTLQYQWQEVTVGHPEKGKPTWANCYQNKISQGSTQNNKTCRVFSERMREERTTPSENTDRSELKTKPNNFWRAAVETHRDRPMYQVCHVKCVSLIASLQCETKTDWTKCLQTRVNSWSICSGSDPGLDLKVWNRF